jgi:hypothetical protein
VLEAQVEKSTKEILSLSFLCDLSVWFYYRADFVERERARSDDDDDHAFDRENRGGCL